MQLWISSVLWTYPAFCHFFFKYDFLENRFVIQMGEGIQNHYYPK